MTTQDRLVTATTALQLGLPDGCIDTAALVAADPAASPDDRARAAILAARGMIAKELYSDALAWLDQVPADSAHAGTAAAFRGFTHVQRGEPDAARAALDRATSGLSARAHYYKAWALNAVERRADAYAALGAAVEDPEVGALALRTRGRWRLADGNRDEGIADLVAAARRGESGAAQTLAEHDAVTDEPAVRAAHHKARAEIAMQQGDFDAAAAEYATAVKLAPQNRELLAGQGWALVNGTDEPGGRALLEQALAIAGTPEEDARIAGYLGDAYFLAADRSAAIAHYRRAHALAPRNPTRMQRLALMLDGEGQTDEAQGLQLQAAVAGDDNAITYCREHGVDLPADMHDRGCDWLASDHSPTATATLLNAAAERWQALSRAKGDYCARHAGMALSNLSVALMKGERRDEALEASRRAVEARPGFRDGWINRGNQLAAAGQLTEALAAFERASACDPHYPGGHYGASDVLRRLGRVDATITALERAATIGYEDDERRRDVHYRLARALHAAGRFEDAALQYEQVTEIEGDEDTASSDAMRAIAGLVEAGAGELEPAPYRRYGLRPSTWKLDDQIALRLRFAADLDADARAEVEAIIEGVIDDSSEVSDEPVAWSGPFAFVTLATDPDGDFPTEAFETLEAIADAVHEVRPLAEAVGLSAIGMSDDDMGELWSVATQFTPDAGPEYKHAAAFWAGRYEDTTALSAPAAIGGADEEP